MRLTKSRADALDLAQETYLRAWRAWGGFRAGSNPLTWMVSIMRNAYIQQVRADAHHAHLSGEHALDVLLGTRGDDAFVCALREECGGVSGVIATSRTPEDDVVATEPTESDVALADALGQIPAHLRDLVRRVYLRDESQAAVAAEQAVPWGTVRSRLRVARERMRDHLGSAGAERWARGT
jgi:RNA polymerase sigma-70 factor (ECF subfamily)